MSEQNAEFNKTSRETLQRIMSSPAPAPEESMDFFDSWADEDFAREHGIKVEDIPAYIAKMQQNAN